MRVTQAAGRDTRRRPVRKRRTVWRWALVSSVCVGLGGMCDLTGRVRGDEIEAKAPASNSSMFRPPEDPETAKRIERLIAELRSPDYQERSRAVQHLTDLGPRAFAQLRDAYRQTDDLELSLQIEKIVQSAYLNFEVYSQHGFLGVSLYPYPYPVQRGRGGKDWETAELPDDTRAVELTNVIDDTGASRAGLTRGDVILAVDGKPLEATGAQLVDSFSRGISQRRPGDTMTLTVVHASEEREDIEVTLGTCPPELAQRGRVRAVHERLQEASQEFDVWWNQEFRGASTATADAKSSP